MKKFLEEFRITEHGYLGNSGELLSYNYGGDLIGIIENI